MVWRKWNGPEPKQRKNRSHAIRNSKKSKKKQSDVFNVKYGHKNINFTALYEYLRVNLDPHLSLNSHFESLYKEASSKVRLLHKIWPMLSKEAALYRDMIQSAWTYCGFVSLIKNESKRKKLLYLQERACTKFRLSYSIRPGDAQSTFLCIRL